MIPRSAKAALLAGCLALAACGTETLRIRGVRPLNLNDAGESTPVDVRIYLLKDDQAFLDADFDDLWLKDEAVLQDAMAGKPLRVTVLPGEEGDDPAEVELGDVDAGVRYVGVMAMYGQAWKGQKRRRVVNVQDVDNVVFELRGYGVTLDIEKEFAVLDPTTPVEIRIHPLAGETQFLETDFDDVWRDPRTALEEDLRGQPVEKKVLPVDDRGLPPVIEIGPLESMVQVLGVAALFETRGRTETRRSAIRLSERTEYTFDLCGYGITIRVKRD